MVNEKIGTYFQHAICGDRRRLSMLSSVFCGHQFATSTHECFFVRGQAPAQDLCISAFRRQVLL